MEFASKVLIDFGLHIVQYSDTFITKTTDTQLEQLGLIYMNSKLTCWDMIEWVNEFGVQETIEYLIGDTKS